MRTPKNKKASAEPLLPAAPTKPGESGSTELTKYLAAGFCTTAPIGDSRATGNLAVEFIRVPDCERLFGLKRGLTSALIKQGVLKSVCLRKPGAKTGVRLIHAQGVRDWLNSKLT